MRAFGGASYLISQFESMKHKHLRTPPGQWIQRSIFGLGLWAAQVAGYPVGPVLLSGVEPPKSEDFRGPGREAQAQNLRNIQTIVSQPDDPLLPPGSIDLAFFCDTVHEIGGRVDYY